MKLGRFSAPAPLSSDLPQSEKYDGWLKWKSTFDIAISIMDGVPSNTQKVGLLYTHVGNEVRDLITMLKLPPMHVSQQPESALYGILTKGLNDYFRTLVDESSEYARYTARKQAAGESVHHFAMKLRELGERVGVAYDSIPFKHQFVAGLANREFAVKAKEDGLLIGVILERAGRMEQDAEAEKKWAQTDRHGESVMKLTAGKEWKKPFPERKRRRSPQRLPTGTNKCSGCGLTHVKGQKCLAIGKKCLKCGKMNHYARVCRSGAAAGSSNEQCQPKNEDETGDQVK